MKRLQNLAKNRKTNIQRSNLVPNEKNNLLEKQKKVITNKISIDSFDKNNINKAQNNSISYNKKQSLELIENKIEILEVIDENPDAKIRESKTGNKNEVKFKLKDVKGKRTDLNEEIKIKTNDQNKNYKHVFSEQINRGEKPKQKININCIQDITNEKDLNIAELKNKIKVYEEKIKMYKEIESKFKVENRNIIEELKIYKDENKNLKTELEIFKNKNNELFHFF